MPPIPIVVGLLSIKRGLRNSIISQVLSVPSSKCRRRNTKLGIGTVRAFVLLQHKSVFCWCAFFTT